VKNNNKSKNHKKHFHKSIKAK